MPTVQEIVERLQTQASPGQLEGMARFAITGKGRLGVSVPGMRKLAREITREAGRDHQLALDLWKTGIPEAMILASMVDEPGAVTEAQMEDWVADFQSWDVCDQVCMNLFERTPLAWQKILDWSRREEEFVKRAAFALIACLAWHDKEAPDEAFTALMPVIKAGATDERNFVKKGVSWALRNIGKRNPSLNQLALQAAKEIGKLDSRSAKWIASQARRDLTSAATRRRLAR